MPFGMECDSGGHNMKANNQYKCHFCDYTICEVCFNNGESHNPGHPLRRMNVSAQALSSTVPERIQAQERHDHGDIVEASVCQPLRPCCSICCNYTPDFLRRDNPNGSWRRNNRFKLDEFAQSAKKGCKLCSIVYRGVAKVISAELAEKADIYLVIRADRIIAEIYRWDHGITRQICFRGNPAYLPSWNELKPREILCPNLRDKRCFDKIRQWLTVCENTHAGPRCQQSAEVQLPRRLIVINNASDSLSLKLKLFDGEIGKYIALSHCWGGYDECQTTTANIAARTSGIDYDSLPKTFKDAVYCAMELKVSYLWIDCLCIIQDDAEDWESESAKMCDIYSNAYFVLAAASASADTQGFLTEPDSFHRGFSLASDTESGILDLTAYDDMHHIDDPFISRPGPRSGVSDEPLDKRAWTLQETLLARRCIVFGRYEVSWQCESSGECECGGGDPYEQYMILANISGTNFWKYWLFTELLGDTISLRVHYNPLVQLTDMASTFRAWRQLVVPNYTARSLTKSKDKLPALSGVAEKIARSFDDTYLAGIWLNDVRFGLLWIVKKDPIKQHPDRPIHTPYLGPSFSWVSVDTEVAYKLPGDSPANDPYSRFDYGTVTIKILDYDISLSSRNPYGSVESGWLKMTAQSHSLRLRWSPDLEDRKLTALLPQQPVHVAFFPDAMLCGIKSQDSDDQQNMMVKRAMSEGEGAQTFDTLVTGILMLDVPRSHRNRASNRPIQCHDIALLVLSASATAPGMFQRIGAAVMGFEYEDAERWIQCAEEKGFTII